jgi:hypothetical protein
MKFGETLYQRSIPQWAPYNVDYNSLKRLIKQRTTETATEPVAIPGQGSSHARWQPLDDELFPILKHEHDRAALFIRSKLGEINRRLTHIERQTQLGEQKTTPSSRPIQQTRRYQRLVEDADSIGNDIEALSRFASVQRLAFRKILKKYRKWTASLGLHIRMNNEVLGHVPKEDDQVLGKSKNALNPDMSPYLIRLNAATTTIESVVDKQRLGQSSSPALKPVTAQRRVPKLSLFEFERALIDNPGSRTKSTYWIHHDNLDEIKVLLMRRLGPWMPSGARESSTSKTNLSNVVLLDDDSGLAKKHNIPVAKMLARWSEDDFAYIRERQNDKQTLEEVRRKDVLERLEQKTTSSLKQVALIKSTRERFAKNENVARIATLETNIQIGHFNHTSLNDAITLGEYPIHLKAFPYSVLTLSYTDSQTIPKIVTVLDYSHLVQLVPDFSLESQAMYSEVRRFEHPPWKLTLENDIRKVPAAVPKKRVDRGRQRSITASSGPSSTEGQDSIFSQARKQSSQTSLATSTDALPSPLPTKQKDPLLAAGGSRNAQKKRKSYGTIQAKAPQRYWNEFDDDPEFNGEEAYTIYVTPDEPFKFPGSETISKAFGAVFQSLSKNRVASWLSLDKNHRRPPDERTSLLSHASSPTETDREADVESSSDDNIPVKAKRIASRSARRGTSRYSDYSALGYPRRTSRDQLLSYTSVGLHILAWMFLLMATVLKSTGRKKAAIEVDAGVISGATIAVACGMFAIGCAFARQEHVSFSEWTIVSLLVVCELVWGICLGVWVAESAV